MHETLSESTIKPADHLSIEVWLQYYCKTYYILPLIVVIHKQCLSLKSLYTHIHFIKAKSVSVQVLTCISN